MLENVYPSAVWVLQSSRMSAETKRSGGGDGWFCGSGRSTRGGRRSQTDATPSCWPGRSIRNAVIPCSLPWLSHSDTLFAAMLRSDALLRAPQADDTPTWDSTHTECAHSLRSALFSLSRVPLFCAAALHRTDFWYFELNISGTERQGQPERNWSFEWELEGMTWWITDRINEQANRRRERYCSLNDMRWLRSLCFVLLQEF